MEELYQLRLKTMRSHVQVKWKNPIDSDFGENYIESLKQIEERSDRLWNPKIPKMIQAYFEDLKTVFSNLKTIAHKNASLWLVVSTSAYAGIEIPVDLILAEIGSKTQWFLREIQVMRYLRRVPVQQWDDFNFREKPYLRESIIIFDADRN